MRRRGAQAAFKGEEIARENHGFGTFETRDFYLACFLRYAGYDLLNLRAEGWRRVFVFQDRPTRRNDVIAFYGDAAIVRPLAYAATIKDMKGLLHNG